MAYWKKILTAAIIYIVLGILIGYLFAQFAIYAAMIAALIAGIYIGMGTTPIKGAVNGFIAGLIGGIIAGFITPYVPNIMGIQMAIPMGGWLNALVVGAVTSAIPWLAVPSMAIVGFVFGAIGGFIGAKLKR